MSFDPNKITFFARTDARGKNVTFGIKAKDRQRHVYVIGKTGMGKSTLLENMAAQDIQNGEGMAFIDPHGSAAETLLNYIPEHRKEDVVYFAPFDMDHPISFNIMEDVGPDKRHLVVSGLMSVFKKIWVDAWSARMEYILSNTLLALLEYPDSTLLSVNRMLADKDYRKKVVDNVKDPSVKSFWVDEFAKYTERFAAEATPAIQNKIGQFTSNPVIRNIVGQPHSSFDIRKMMDEKKILIMNLSKGLIGESNANLLGSMLTTRIYLAAMSRADLSPEKMAAAPNFYFYVDEFQSFANATFANILSEARKYHLNLTIAHQYIEQMEEEVRDAVFGNVGTIIAFRVGPLDAEFLETIFAPQFLATDIVNLGFAQIYLTLMIDGIGSQAFSATTLPPVARPAVSCKDMVIAASRRQFSKPREEVELMIHKFHEPVVVPPKLSRKDDEGGAPRREVPRSESRERYGNERRSTPTGERRERPREETNRSTEERREVRPEVRTDAVSTLETKAEGMEQRAHEVREENPNPHVTPYEKRESRERTGGQPERREQRARTGEQPHRQKQENLEDLRSVLKRIVNTPEAHGQSGKADDKKKFEATRGELKSALTSVLQTVPQPNAPDDEVRENATTEVASSSIESVPEPILETSPRSPMPSTTSGEASGVTKPPVTPKELERMMRVTTSDKPPF